MALKMTGSREDAEDIAQEAFIRVYRSLGSFKGDSRFSTWLYRIVSNLCADFGRRTKRMNEILINSIGDDDERTFEIPDSRFGPESELENDELRRELNEAIESLGEAHREIFLLREISGLSYTDISEATGLEEGTVKSRLFRARKYVRDFLAVRGNILLPEASNVQKAEKRGDGLE